MVGQLGSRGLATWARRGHSARARELKVSHGTSSRGSLTIHRDILPLDNLSLKTEQRCERKKEWWVLCASLPVFIHAIDMSQIAVLALVAEAEVFPTVQYLGYVKIESNRSLQRVRWTAGT